MLVAYYSMTGNCRRFITTSGIGEDYETFEISQKTVDDEINEPFILVTSTIGFGQVPEPVKRFLKKNHRQLIAVAASGNRNWGQNFAKAGEHISNEYQVPLIMKFELHGNEQDKQEFRKKVGAIYESFGREKVQSY